MTDDLDAAGEQCIHHALNEGGRVARHETGQLRPLDACLRDPVKIRFFLISSEIESYHGVAEVAGRDGRQEAQGNFPRNCRMLHPLRVRTRHVPIFSRLDAEVVKVKCVAVPRVCAKTDERDTTPVHRADRAERRRAPKVNRRLRPGPVLHFAQCIVRDVAPVIPHEEPDHGLRAVAPGPERDPGRARQIPDTLRPSPAQPEPVIPG